MPATWPALKDYPFNYAVGVAGYENYGYVCQAEELLVGGRWKRYFGFVCKHGAAVVPVGDITLWPPYDEASGIGYDHLSGGVKWGTTHPWRRLQDGK